MGKEERQEFEKSWQIGKILEEGGSLEEMKRKFELLPKGVFLWYKDARKGE